MSLYHEAAKVLDTACRDGGSVKSIVFGRKEWKSDRKRLFALCTETSKWSDVLSDVIERSDILKIEKQLTPRLTLLLTHDLLLAKKGLVLPSKHGLCIAITRHKARLAAELTRVRINRGFATLDALKLHAESGLSSDGVELGNRQQNNLFHPRWVRINTLLSSRNEQLNTTFAAYKQTKRLCDINAGGPPKENLVYIDQNVPNLIAVRPDLDITKGTAYKDGKLILQDKASCFPAYLLDPSSMDGDIIDACAAPGNKTTHLAALVSSHNGNSGNGTPRRNIIACERDGQRSETLSKMVKLAGANEIVRIKFKQDFLKLNPQSSEFANVTGILLDPSCSGSGIVGRDETTVDIRLPQVDPPRDVDSRSKKRKRDQAGESSYQISPVPTAPTEVEEETTGVDDSASKVEARLTALSSFQLRLLEHAMAFPAAVRITFSTCSIHKEENEHVVVKALCSKIAVTRGWRILRREEQVAGLQKWNKRGNLEGTSEMLQKYGDSKTSIDAVVVADSCIRCEKGSEDGTMGFFVAGFVRDSNSVVNGDADADLDAKRLSAFDNSEDEWNGFSDDDR